MAVGKIDCSNLKNILCLMQTKKKNKQVDNQ
jgi:hypothetical protein